MHTPDAALHEGKSARVHQILGTLENSFRVFQKNHHGGLCEQPVHQDNARIENVPPQPVLRRENVNFSSNAITTRLSFYIQMDWKVLQRCLYGLNSKHKFKRQSHTTVSQKHKRSKFGTLWHDIRRNVENPHACHIATLCPNGKGPEFVRQFHHSHTFDPAETKLCRRTKKQTPLSFLPVIPMYRFL